MDFQVVEVNKEDKIVIVTSKTEYTFTPERYDMVYVMCVMNFTKRYFNYPACVITVGTNSCRANMVLCYEHQGCIQGGALRSPPLQK